MGIAVVGDAMAPYTVQDRRRSFDRLYRRHRAEIFRAALRATGDRYEAEEVTQTAFLDAYRAWIGGDLPREPRAWLFAIAENTRRRRYSARARRPEEAALAEVADERLAAEGPTVREIRAALFELPERQRAVVVLREIGGLSYAEIGDELDLSVAAVQMLLFRARRALRSRLAPSAPVVTLPGWLTGWADWLGGGGVAGPAVRAAGAAGALAIGLVVSAGGAPRAAAADPGATASPPASVVSQRVGQHRAPAAAKQPRAPYARIVSVQPAAPARTRSTPVVGKPPSPAANPASAQPAPTPQPAPGAVESSPLPAPRGAPVAQPAVPKTVSLPAVSTPELDPGAALGDLAAPVTALVPVELPPVELPSIPAITVVPPATLPVPPLPPVLPGLGG